MQEIKAAYHAMIELLDDVIGGVLATARCSATAAYTAEGVTLLRRTGKVPLQFSWPRGLDSIVASDALVEMVDVTPPCSTPPAWSPRRPCTAARSRNRCSTTAGTNERHPTYATNS